MRNQRMINPSWLALSDYISAALAWIVAFFIRKYLSDFELNAGTELLYNTRLQLSLIFIPGGWLILFMLLGSYHHSLYTRSYVQEFMLIFFATLSGSLVLFFLLVLDDKEAHYPYYYKAFFSLFIVHLVFFWTGRMLFLNKAKKQLRKGYVRFNTILIGNNPTALSVYKEIKRTKPSSVTNSPGLLIFIQLRWIRSAGSFRLWDIWNNWKRFSKKKIRIR